MRLHIPGLRQRRDADRGVGPAGRLTRRAPDRRRSRSRTALVVADRLPFLQIDLGSADAGSNPTSTTTRRAYDLLSEGFGAGYNGAIVLAVAVNNPRAIPAVQAAAGDNCARWPVWRASRRHIFNATRTAATIIVTPKTSPQDAGDQD